MFESIKLLIAFVFFSNCPMSMHCLRYFLLTCHVSTTTKQCRSYTVCKNMLWSAGLKALMPLFQQLCCGPFQGGISVTISSRLFDPFSMKCCLCAVLLCILQLLSGPLDGLCSAIVAFPWCLQCLLCIYVRVLYIFCSSS